MIGSLIMLTNSGDRKLHSFQTSPHVKPSPPDKDWRSKGDLIVSTARNPGQHTSPIPVNGRTGRITVASPPPPPTKKDGLELIRKLPPLPMVVTKLLQLLQRRDVSLKELSESITSDPGFSVEVLRMANSAMIGAMSEIRSIWQALAMIGLDRVKGLALTVGLHGFMGKNANSPVLRKTWRHTLATAILAEEIADKIYIDPAEAYTAGLLHDIGSIALIASNPQKYTDILDLTINQLYKDEPFSEQSLIANAGLVGKVFVGGDSSTTEKFSDNTKSAAFIRNALKSALKCPICDGYLDPIRSVSYDHIIRVQDGGMGSSGNCDLTHPYCNQSVKN